MIMQILVRLTLFILLGIITAPHILKLHTFMTERGDQTTGGAAGER